MRLRLAEASGDGAPIPLTTSRWSPPDEPETPKTCRPAGKSTPTTLIYPSWLRPWTLSCHLTQPLHWANLVGLVSLTWKGYGPGTRTPPHSSRRLPPYLQVNPLPECKKSTLNPSNQNSLPRGCEDIRNAGVTVAGALSPARTQEFSQQVIDAGVDLFVIRGTTVSAEHVSSHAEPLNLKRFIYELDVPVIVGGAASYTAALHLMRTGAAGVLVGFGGGAAHTTRTSLGIHVPMATAVADVAAARRDYLDESGGRYVHVIADGGVGRSGDLVKAFAVGADAVMIGAGLARASEAPGQGWHWGPEAHHPQLPRGERVHVGTAGSLEEILFGPGTRADGTLNMVGALRRAMATTGYSELKEFQRIEVVVSPYAGSSRPATDG